MGGQTENMESSKISKWINMFCQSRHFLQLSNTQKDNAAAVISMFADCMRMNFDSSPEEWNVEDVEECCIEIMPMKVSAGAYFFESIETVLSAFFNFAGETNLVAEGPKIAQNINGMGHKILENASNPENWGHAKALIMEAKNAGVDISNKNELNAFMTFLNMQQINRAGIELRKENTNVRKAGRNDVCPCGSGMKYKKCCIWRESP